MPVIFDQEKLLVYQKALDFVGWVGPVLDGLSGRIAAKDQLDRASTSIVLNIAEGNGKRSHADRCRFLDIARGSVVECAACLDVLFVRGKIVSPTAEEGKQQLLAIVSMVAGLIARFGGGEASGRVGEDAALYGAQDFFENENE